MRAPCLFSHAPQSNLNQFPIYIYKMQLSTLTLLSAISTLATAQFWSSDIYTSSDCSGSPIRGGEGTYSASCYQMISNVHSLSFAFEDITNPTVAVQVVLNNSTCTTPEISPFEYIFITEPGCYNVSDISAIATGFVFQPSVQGWIGTPA